MQRLPVRLALGCALLRRLEVDCPACSDTVHTWQVAVRESRNMHPAPNALLVQALVAQFRVTLQAIAGFDTAIAQRVQSHPDFPMFQALPGAGPVFAPRLLVAFGKQRERYASAAALQKYAGIAPVTARSGKKAWVHGASSVRSFSNRRL